MVENELRGLATSRLTAYYVRMPLPKEAVQYPHFNQWGVRVPIKLHLWK